MKIQVLLLTALLAASCESPDSVGAKDTSHTQGPPEGLRYTYNPVVYALGVAAGANPVVFDRGAPITSFSISPSTLPAGLSFDPTTGAITGTPTAIAADTAYMITGYNGYGSRFVSLEIRTTNAIATHLSFTVDTTNAVSGTALSPTLQVSALAANGSVDTTFDFDITLAIGTNAGSGTLLGTKTVTATGGVASFPGIAIDKIGTGYTLTASSAGVTTATSSPFNITAGAATQVKFKVQPASATAGAGISPAIQVGAYDGWGNPDTTYAGTITLAIGTNSGGGTLSGTTSVAAVSGVASFPGLGINKSGAGYTLAASASGLTGATSSAFNITAGAATQLAFSAQPSNAVAATTIAPAISVKGLDAFGNLDTTFSGIVTVAIGTNPGGGTLSGTLAIPAVSGTATFSNLSINKTGAGYTLTAASGTLTGATSSTFNITPAGPTELKFIVQPSNTQAQATITPAIQVGAFDASGNLVPTYTPNITLAIASNPGGGTLSGTTTIAPTSGISAYSNLSINKMGNAYTLTATSGTLTSATSSTFNISAGAATQIKFSVEPANTVSSVGIAPSVQVTAYDPAMNVDPTYSANVTLAIGTNPGPGTLSGTKTVAAVNGVATFPGLSIDKAASGYTLTAISGVLAGDTSSTFTITPAGATQVKFTVQPSNAVSGAANSPSVQVTAYDANLNVATGFSSNVTIAIGTNPGGGTLSGTTTVAASSGVATFANLKIDKVGTGYTLTAASAGLTGDTSGTFNILPGTATQLKFTAQPTNTVSAVAISPSVQVTAYDANLNVATGYSANVTLAIGTNPGGGTLSGTATVAASSGIASFTTLNIDKAGTGYTLAATSGILTGATSNTFNITPAAATQLAFTVQPSNTAAAASVSPAVHVTAYDPNMNVDTNYSSNVTVAIGTNPSGGTLSGTLTVAAVSGVASFANLSINKVGTGYTLTAASGALSGSTSSAFNVTPAAATQLKFTVQPSNAVAGASNAPSIEVTAYDANLNLATAYSGNVTLAIGTNPSGGTLSGTVTVAASSGVATFANISINKVGTGYTLTAASGALTGATSSTFNITPASATQLLFTVQPTNTVSAVSLSPSVQVTAYDANLNVDTNYAANITLAIGTNPGGGTLSGTKTIAASSGVATFPGLSINKSGTGYTLAAASGSLTGATSNAFNITPAAATQLKFTVQPTNTAAASSVTPAVQVTAYDPNMNVDTNYSANVTVAIGTNPGGGTLSGTKTVAASSGVASFSTLNINIVGTGYTLTATSGALSGDTSSAFNITPAAATQLKFTVQPSNTVAGVSIAPAIQVTAYDANLNVATSFSSNVTIAIGTNAGGGTLSGTVTVAASSGIATFSNLSLNKVGTGYTLTAASGVLTGATSNAFNITPAAATQLKFTVQPTNAVSAAAVSPSVQLTAYDANLNVDINYAANITLAIGTNPGGGTLSGTVTVAASSGVASFAGLNIDKAGTGYTLAASSGTLAGATSNTFNITPAAATQLKFTVQPTNTAAASSITPAVLVTAYDANLNVDTNYSANVTAAIGTNPGGGTLSGTKTVAAASGVATFSTLNINIVGTGYTLAATSGALSSATSNTFNITPATATQLKFTVQPSNTVAGVAIAPAIQVTAYDANLNVATSYSSNVTIAIGTNPGGSALSGTATVAASSGVATFSSLSLNKVGTAYTVTAASGVLTGATSSAFNITPASATQLKFTVQPTSAVSATAISPAVQVTAYDANMNIDTNYAGSITVGISTNPGSGTLSGTKAISAASGVSSFSTLSIDKAGTGYTLSASSGALTTDTSSAFTISAGTATTLSFSAQPTDTLANVTMSPAVTVSAQDNQGNTVTGYSGSITVAIGTNPAAGTLSGTVTASAVNGVSTFSNFSINNAGTGYTFTATATGLTGAISSSFDIDLVIPTKLVFNVQPSSATDCTSVSPSIQVYAVDGSNHLATTYTTNVTMAFGTNAGGGTLSGTTTVAASGGIASFSNLSVDKPANGYTLSASSGTLANGTSSSFNISAGAVASIAFSTEPANSRPTGAISPSIVVTAYDSCSGGQIATNFSGNITLSFQTNPTGAALGGTLTHAAASGAATFSNVTVSKSGYSAGGEYALSATDGTHTVTSSTFNVGIDLVAPIELLDSGVSSSNGGTTTFGRSETGFDSSKYDGTVTYTSEALCTNSDSVSRNLTIVDQGSTARGTIAVPATGALTYVTGTFTPVGTITSLNVMLDRTTSNNQLVCTMARVLVRQQYASKTRIYQPLSALAFGFSSNTDVNNAGSLNATTTPIAMNTGNNSTNMTNPERTHRITFNTALLGSTIVGYALEAVCSSNQSNAGAVELYNITAAADVGNSETGNCPHNTLGLVTSSWTTDTDWISGDDFEVRVLKSGGLAPSEWLYKAGLWIELSNLQMVSVPIRVGAYSSDSATAIHNSQGAIINTSYYQGVTNSNAIFFEASGRDSTAGTSDLELYTITGSGSIMSSNITFGSTTKARIREATGLSLTDGDQFATKANVTSGTLENSGTFVIINTQ